MAQPQETKEVGALRIRQVKGWAGKRKAHREILRGLGLGRPGRTVVREDTPAIRGMVAKVIYMLEVEVVDGAEETSS